MKKFIRALSLALSLLTLLASLASCGAGQKMIELGGQSMSVNLYEFFLSRQKGTLCTTYYYGSEAKSDSFWRTTISPDGTTYDDFWTSYIFDSVKVYLAALYVFEEVYDLTLPDSYVKDVDAELEDLVEYDADGSKSEFNKILAQYGINYKMLREVYLLEAKIKYLQNYLYGSDLSKVSEGVQEEYYQDNYVRFKQVFFANYHYVYETDKSGQVIYYNPSDTDGSPSILYDKSTGIRKFDSSGKAIADKNGDIIYYNEDGTVAYDSENGVPSHLYNEDGKYLTALYGKDEMQEFYNNAEEMVEFNQEGDTVSFEKMIKEYSDEDTASDYPNGYYFLTSSNYNYDYINDIVAELGQMRDGQIRIVESDYGYHVVMKYALDKGAYAEDDNAEWFEDFSSGVVQWLFTLKCEEYLDQIKLNKDLASSIRIVDVLPNFNY